MPPRISKHFANRAKYYFLFYGCGNQLWERLNFLPRDTEETVAEPRWEPKSPELQRCVLVTRCTKAQQGSLLVTGSQPSSVKPREVGCKISVGAPSLLGLCPGLWVGVLSRAGSGRGGCLCPPGLGRSALVVGGCGRRRTFGHC